MMPDKPDKNIISIQLSTGHTIEGKKHTNLPEKDQLGFLFNKLQIYLARTHVITSKNALAFILTEQGIDPEKEYNVSLTGEIKKKIIDIFNTVSVKDNHNKDIIYIDTLLERHQTIKIDL